MRWDLIMAIAFCSAVASYLFFPIFYKRMLAIEKERAKELSSQLLIAVNSTQGQLHSLRVTAILFVNIFLQFIIISWLAKLLIALMRHEDVSLQAWLYFLLNALLGGAIGCVIGTYIKYRNKKHSLGL